MKIEKIPIEKIVIKERVREELGDMEVLKNSIRKYGLLNPVLVDQNYRLIAGERRLRAAKELGFTTIDANVVPEQKPLVRFDMEMQENLARKEFTEAEINKSIEMKKKLLRKPWYVRLSEFFKRMWAALVSLFQRK